MKNSASVLLLFFYSLCFSQVEFNLNNSQKISNLDGDHFIVSEQTSNIVNFTEYDLNLNPIWTIDLNILSYTQEENVFFQSITRFGQSELFLIVLSRNLTGNNNLYWQSDTVENHYFKFDRDQNLIIGYAKDTSLYNRQRLVSHSNNFIYQLDISGNHEVTPEFQNAQLYQIDSDLNVLKIGVQDSIKQDLNSFEHIFFKGDSLNILYYRQHPDEHTLKLNTYDLNPQLHSSYSKELDPGADYVDIKGWQLNENSINMIKIREYWNFQNGSTYYWSGYTTDYQLNTVNEIELEHSPNHLFYDGGIDLTNQKYVVLAKNIEIDYIKPNDVLIYDFLGNLECVKSLYEHSEDIKPVDLVSLNNKVYLKTEVNDSTFNWKPITCEGLNIAEYESIINTFECYPNPTKNILNIRTTTSGTVSIFDIQGRKIFIEHINQGNTQFNLPALVNGTYLIEFNNSNYRTIEKLIID